ncbi:unnamed protein product [Zymoseptoria tritici ST99CH_3D1]|nr:unnamed protein product [Zymoseptoria tritici ST99CH_3D1]
MDSSDSTHIPPIETTLPPSYQLVSSRTIPIIIHMYQVLPDKPLGPNLLLAGPLLKHQPDLLSLPLSATYGELILLLHQRVLARSGVRVPSKSKKFYCRAVLVADGQEILLEVGSWEAAKEVLEKWKHAELSFLFAIVDRGYKGVGMWERLRRMFWGLGGGSVCLVEPRLATQE